MFKSNYFKIIMKINKVMYGKGLSLRGFPIIFKTKDSKIIIGDNCTINSSFISNLVGLYQRTIILARNNSNIIIGKNVGISGATLYARKSIVIGDNTLIGGNTKILDNDFHPIDTEARINNDSSMIKSKEVLIGKNVFIGCNSLILKGTIIGDNCIVGAGSVVSGKFPNNVIIAGNPAKVINTVKEVTK